MTTAQERAFFESGEARLYLLTLGLVLAGLAGAIVLGLLPVLLAGLLVYEIVEFGASRLGRYGLDRSLGRVLLFGGLGAAVLAALALAVAGFAARLTTGPESVAALMERMADVIDAAQTYLPVWAVQYLPSDMDEWKVQIAGWLRGNARDISVVGKDIGLLLFHTLFGMLIGGMIALNPAFQNGKDRAGKNREAGPLARALHGRLLVLAKAFRSIVFSQIRISAVNTALTAVFLFAVEPLMGVDLPLTKTMVAVTFFTGLLPIIGNLISNTVIFLIALSVSPLAAVSALVFLIVIHKLEYFINARIIGSRISARAWELLLAMVTMEAAFGLAGLVAAPIYYAYLKEELSSRGLI